MDADVYILGQGFDFAEMDLWWLVNQKAMQKNGKMVFYEPKSDRTYDAKIELLKAYGVTPVDFGVETPEKPGHKATEEQRLAYREEKSRLYGAFYEQAIADMKERFTGEAPKQK